MDALVGLRPSIVALREALRADFATGKLFWKVRPLWHFADNRAHAMFNGRYAGTEALTGYNEHGRGGRISFGGARYAVRRSHVIWALKTGAWPTQEIGHRNRDWHDDRFENLRQQTESQKAAFGHRTSSKSGLKGIRVVKSGKFLATITQDGERKCLGTFVDIEDACAARNAAASRLHGEFAHLLTLDQLGQ